MLVNDFANFYNTGFKNAVGRRVGDHQTTEFIAVLNGFGAEVFDVDVAIVVATHYHHLHAGHHRRSRIGTMGRRRN